MNFVDLRRYKYWAEHQASRKPISIAMARKTLSDDAFWAWLEMTLVTNPDDLWGKRQIQKYTKRSRVLYELHSKRFVVSSFQQGGVQLAVVRKVRLENQRCFNSFLEIVQHDFPYPDDAIDTMISGCHRFSTATSKILYCIIKNGLAGRSRRNSRNVSLVINKFISTQKKSCTWSECHIRCFEILNLIRAEENIYGKDPKTAKRVLLPEWIFLG